jgi:TetR/AcrR family transcriptional regulator, tetracycline repressor protein
MSLNYLNGVNLVKVTNDEQGFARWGRDAPRGRHRARAHLLRQRHRLEPEVVVQAALEVLDQAGLDGLSIRAIADRLGVRGPALYWHFRNKQALLDEMAEAMLAERAAELRPPAADEAWWDWLAQTAGWLRRALLSHRDGARVFAGTTLPSEPTFLRMLDMVVAALYGVGFAWGDALRAAMSIYVYVEGWTIEEQSMPPPEALAPAEEFPNAADLPALRAGFAEFELDADRGFEHGLGLLLAGLRSSLPAGA